MTKVRTGFRLVKRNFRLSKMLLQFFRMIPADIYFGVLFIVHNEFTASVKPGNHFTDMMKIYQ